MEKLCSIEAYEAVGTRLGTDLLSNDFARPVHGTSKDTFIRQRINSGYLGIFTSKQHFRARRLDDWELRCRFTADR